MVERQPFALWCLPPAGAGGAQAGDGHAQCYNMDSGGFIFAEASATQATSTGYVFQGGIGTSTSPISQTFIPTHLRALIALLTQLGQSGFTPLGATVENDTDFSVPLTRGYFIKASFGEDEGALVKNLQLVLDSGPLQSSGSQLEYVDLRFGDHVYYKLFSGGESALGGKGQTEATSTPQ